MCIRSFVITLVAGMSLLTATAQAQGTAQQAGATPAASQQRTPPIAVIDLGYILRNHPTMKQQIEGIKAQTEAEGAKFEQKRQAILKQMEELRENYTEGTPDYMAKEKAIAEADTQFRLEVVRKNKEFDEARAQIFFEVHRQVTHIVKFYCEHTDAAVVLKVAREQPDPKKPE
ncbi:MAG: OmpH family outer membrane protein, partial [Aureliella sp.]